MRGMILGLAVGLAVLLTAGEGRAQGLHVYQIGHALNEVCNSDYTVSPSVPCGYYVMGVYDAATMLDAATNKRLWRNGFTACVPKGVSAGQLEEVVKKWLREHPADWHYAAADLVAVSFEAAFPCR